MNVKIHERADDIVAEIRVLTANRNMVLSFKGNTKDNVMYKSILHLQLRADLLPANFLQHYADAVDAKIISLQSEYDYL